MKIPKKRKKIKCYIDMPDVYASYERSSDFIAFFCVFLYFIEEYSSKILYLHQTFTDCVSD